MKMHAASMKVHEASLLVLTECRNDYREASCEDEEYSVRGQFIFG